MAIDAMTPVPTVVGWLLAKDLRKGDHVFDKDGMPTKVTLVHTYTPTEMFRVGLFDGLALKCDDKTVFPIETQLLRTWTAHREYLAKKQKYQYKNRRELLEYRQLADIKVADNLTIPNTKPIHFREEPHPVPPIVVGLWAGAIGKSRNITVNDKHLEYLTTRLSEYGYKLKRVERNIYKITPSVEKGLLARYTPMPKTIPQDYFAGTPEQRIDLLRGYVLARGRVYKEKTDTFIVESTWRTVPRQMQIICESLGMRTILEKKEKSATNWKLRFRTRILLVPNQKSKIRLSQTERRKIVSVDPIEPRLCAHIETEAASFAAGEGFIQCR